MAFQSTLLASAALLSTTALAWGGPAAGANAQAGWGAFGGNGAGAWSAFPPCVSACKDSNIDYSSGSALCTNTDAINTLQKCVDESNCNEADKNSVYTAVAQLCANSGATITQGPFASITATSGGNAWPSGWTTNSAWASAASASGYKGGPMGWGPGAAGGPFGGPMAGQNGGWGPGPWASSGDWTSGPWTSWWGTSGCPASTWPGWTSGSWATDAPWTTWSGCQATTTASQVYTTTISTSGSVIPTTATSYGIKLAQATADSSSGSGSSDDNGNNGNNDNGGDTFNGAAGRNTAFVASAVGLLGVVAGALLL